MTGEDVYYTSADGLDLYARAYGPGDAALTIVCLHGLTRNHKDFGPMIAALDLPFRYVSVDIRGRGRSARDPDPANYMPAKYAEDIVRLLDTLKIDRACLIGTSMGGLIAMILMSMIPERICGVVLNDVGPRVEHAGIQRIISSTGTASKYPDWATATETIARAQARQFPDYSTADWAAFARRTCRELENGDVVADYDSAIVSGTAPAKPGRIAQMAMWKLFDRLKPIPLLVIRGELSDVLSVKTAASMVKRHKNALFVTVPAAGHAPFLSEPEAVSALKPFLTEAANRI
jgi:pimeloyl-ACP methyl ester carboxylesterase